MERASTDTEADGDVDVGVCWIGLLVVIVDNEWRLRLRSGLRAQGANGQYQTRPRDPVHHPKRCAVTVSRTHHLSPLVISIVQPQRLQLRGSTQKVLSDLEVSTAAECARRTCSGCLRTRRLVSVIQARASTMVSARLDWDADHLADYEVLRVNLREPAAVGLGQVHPEAAVAKEPLGDGEEGVPRQNGIGSS